MLIPILGWIIFGLIVATFLTLVVVPTLYYLQKRSVELSGQFRKWLHEKYWGLFDKLTGQYLNNQ